MRKQSKKERLEIYSQDVYNGLMMKAWSKVRHKHKTERTEDIRKKWLTTNPL